MDADGLLDLIEDHIEKDLHRIVTEHKAEVFRILEDLGYDIRPRL